MRTIERDSFPFPPDAPPSCDTWQRYSPESEARRSEMDSDLLEEDTFDLGKINEMHLHGAGLISPYYLPSNSGLKTNSPMKRSSKKEDSSTQRFQITEEESA